MTEAHKVWQGTAEEHLRGLLQKACADHSAELASKNAEIRRLESELRKLKAQLRAKESKPVIVQPMRASGGR